MNHCVGNAIDWYSGMEGSLKDRLRTMCIQAMFLYLNPLLLLFEEHDSSLQRGPKHRQTVV